MNSGNQTDPNDDSADIRVSFQLDRRPSTSRAMEESGGAGNGPVRGARAKKSAKELWAVVRDHFELFQDMTLGAYLLKQAKKRVVEMERSTATGLYDPDAAFMRGTVAVKRARDAIVNNWKHLKPTERFLRSLMIHPDSHFRSAWDCVQVFVLLYLSIMVPYRVGFHIASQGWTYVLDFLMDIYFLIDICLAFFTGYVSEPTGEIVMSPNYVAQRYLRTWFTLDIVASAPVDMIVRAVEGRFACSWDMPDGGCPPGGGDLPAGQLLRFLRFARLARLMKLLRLARISRILQRYEDRAVSIARFMTFARIVFVLFFLGHSLGCMFFFFSNKEWRSSSEDATYFEDGGWFVWDDVDLSYASQATTTEAYIASVYWAFQTVTTVGYGDLTPITLSERIVSTIAMVAGSLMFSVMMSSIFNAMNPDSVKARNAILIDAVSNFAKNNQMPRKLAARVRQFYRRQSHDTVDDRRVITGLSSDLRMDVLRVLYLDFMRENPLFNAVLKRDEEALMLVVSYILPMTIPQAAAVYIRGESADQVFFLFRGEAEIIDDRVLDEAGDTQGAAEELLDENEPTVLGVFGEGAYFGEGSVLGLRRRTETVRSRSSVLTLLAMPFDIASEIVRRDDELYAKIRTIFMERIKKFGSSQDKVSAVRELVLTSPSMGGSRKVETDAEVNLGAHTFLGDPGKLRISQLKNHKKQVAARMGWMSGVIGAKAAALATSVSAMGDKARKLTGLPTSDRFTKNQDDVNVKASSKASSNEAPDKIDSSKDQEKSSHEDSTKTDTGVRMIHGAAHVILEQEKQELEVQPHLGLRTMKSGGSVRGPIIPRIPTQPAVPPLVHNTIRPSQPPARTIKEAESFHERAPSGNEDEPFRVVRAFVLGRAIPGSGAPSSHAEYGEFVPEQSESLAAPKTEKRQQIDADGETRYEYVVIPDSRAPTPSLLVRNALQNLGVALSTEARKPKDLQQLLARNRD